MFGIIGRKGCAGGPASLALKFGAQHRDALETAGLEYRRGKRNYRCSGEMRRDREEHQWRRRLSGLKLTLRRESVGSKQD